MFIWLVEAQPSGFSRMQAHQAAVLAAEFSPDGEQIASASSDGSIRLWANWRADGQWQLVKKLTGHEGPVTCLAYLPDSNLLASGGSDGTVRIWDLSTGEAAHIFTSHAGPVTSVAPFPFGRLLATASEDATVRFWRLPDATPAEVPARAMSGPSLNCWATEPCSKRDSA